MLSICLVEGEGVPVRCTTCVQLMRIVDAPGSCIVYYNYRGKFSCLYYSEGILKWL